MRRCSMLTRSTVLLALASMLAAGCYASHRRSERPCVEDEGILGTGPWRDDVVPPAAGTPALEVVGAPRLILPSGRFNGVALAWNGSGFGLVAAGVPSLFAELDAHGEPIAEPVMLRISDHLAIDHACGRYGVSSANRSSTEGVGLAVLDEAGHVTAGWTDHYFSPVGDVAGLGRDWAVTSWLPDDGETGTLSLGVANGDTLVPETSFTLATDVSRAATVLGEGDVGVVFWQDAGTGDRGRIFAQRIESGAPVGAPTVVLLRASEWPFTAALVRDRVVLAATTAPALRLQLIVLDAETLTEVARARLRDGPPGGYVGVSLAAAVEEGFVVTCARIPSREDPRVEVFVHGLDGEPWGEPLVLPSGVAESSTSCAWNGEEIIVVSARVADVAGIEVQRLRPTFL